MKLGKYELRKPWTKYVDMPIEEKLYWEIRKSIGEDIAKEIELKINRNDFTYTEGNSALEYAAAIARGQK